MTERRRFLVACRVPVSATFLCARSELLESIQQVKHEIDAYVPIPVLHHEEPENAFDRALLHEAFGLDRQCAFKDGPPSDEELNDLSLDFAMLLESPPSTPRAATAPAPQPITETATPVTPAKDKKRSTLLKIRIKVPSGSKVL